MRWLAFALALVAAPLPARACALELILALDVSGSVDRDEFALQVGGLADAFEDPAVAEAVEGLEGGMIATVTYWSGASRQHHATGWHRVSDAAGLARFAGAIRAAPRPWRNFSTAIGQALIHARQVSDTAPADCKRRVIDVSGDGVSNEGRPPAMISGRLERAGYTINGLVIRGAEPDPVEHYELDVIAGPGAFVEIAADFSDYPRAIRRKLLREISPPMIVSDAQ